MLAGALDSVYGIGAADDEGVRRRGRVTRRDLLLQVAELDRRARAEDRATRGRGLAGRRPTVTAATAARARADEAAARNSTDPGRREDAPVPERHPLADQGVWARASAQSRATPTPAPVESVQLALDLGDEPGEGTVSGLPEMGAEERLQAELEILGLDVSRHVVDTYAAFLDALGVTRSTDLLRQRSRAELLVAGVKVATQTPPIRSGRRVVFLTLDDATGPVDATFFEDAQGPYAATVFHSWLLVVRGELRRTGRRGVSLRATGCWELPALFALWRSAPTSAEGLAAVRAAMAVVPEGFGGVGMTGAVAGAAESRSTRPVVSQPPAADPGDRSPAGGMGRRRVLVHSSGFRLSPYADVKPAGEEARDGHKLANRNPRVEEAAPPPSRSLWHRSPGSPG